MNDFVLFHNPSCSKSRGALDILKTQGVNPKIVSYLETPPSKDELKTILGKLGMTPRELLRTTEDEYKSLNLGNKELSEEAILDAMISHPKLIERPIFIVGDKAVVGRPPEKVLDLLKPTL